MKSSSKMEKKGLTAGSSSSCSSSSPVNQQEPNPNHKNTRKTRPAGHPDPDAEVVALQPEDLLAIGRYICNVCGKGFQRDQNLQLHLRSHNVASELRKGGGGIPARRKAYVCPVATCVYSHRSRALSDITGIKKHFNRKHGTKNLLCPRCSKPYAVEADLKAHIKTHGAGDYRCECGGAFTRRNAFEAHRGFCCKLMAEGIRLPPPPAAAAGANSVTGESRTARAGAASFSGCELPDMNEEFVHPADQDEVMAEQPINADLAAAADDQDGAPLASEQLRLAMAMMPEDPDFVKSLPPCLTEMMKAHYEEVFGGFLPANSPPPAVGNRAMPSSPQQAAVANSSVLDFFGGSSSSFMECGTAALSQRSPDLRTDLFRSSSTKNSDFLSLLSTPAMAAPDLFNGSDGPMLASLALRTSNSMDHQPYQAGKPPESSSTTLLQKAGLTGAATNSSCLNLFRLRQESDLADAMPSNFLTLMPSGVTEPSKRTQEPGIGNGNRSACSIYQQDKSRIPSNTTSASSSFFGGIIRSMDAYSQQRESRAEKVATTFLDSFTTSKPTASYTFSSSAIAPSDAGATVTSATERGGLQQAEAAAPPPEMTEKGKGGGWCRG